MSAATGPERSDITPGEGPAFRQEIRDFCQNVRNRLCFTVT